MKKHWIALALTVSFSAIALTAHAATTYSDIQGNWAQTDINSALSMNTMTGFNDNMFHPDAWVTRAEFDSMAAKTLGLSPSKAEQIPSLRNLSQNYWNFSSVDNQSWISAYPSGVYRPTNPLRRVEALAALAGTLNKPLVSSDEADQILSQYTDADQVPSTVRREVATAIKYNLFAIDPKYGSNIIDPLRPITRAETAALLNDLYQDRDIALVQNGQVIAATTTTTTTSTTTSTTNMGTTTTSTTSTAANTNETNLSGNTSENSQASTSYSPYDTANKPKWWKSGAAPYRNSADTIVEARSINQTTTPNNLEATAAANIPSNVTFTATVAKALYSEFNKPGDPVLLILDHNLMDASDKVAVPAGSKLLGFVSSVVSRNQSGDNAQIGVNLTEFITPTGQRIPINASIANADGVLKASELQGVVFHPDHSLAALKREINTAEGGMYGTNSGKASVLEEPYSTQVSNKPLDPMDKRASDIVIGVGDRIQVKTGGPSTTSQ